MADTVSGGTAKARALVRAIPLVNGSPVVERLKDLPEELRRSITFDNGAKNRRHHHLCDRLGVRTYFCAPYSSWQEGSVENAVGLTLRVWPKKTDYTLISDQEIAMVEWRLNTRPRKRFGYLKPFEYATGVGLSP